MSRLIDADALIETIENHPVSVSCCATIDIAKGKMQMMKQVLDDIRNAPTISVWISVKDRLPSEYGNYIAFCEGEVMECTYAPPKTGMIPGWSTCDANGIHFLGEKSVTHWMEMPEPPKEEQGNAVD